MHKLVECLHYRCPKDMPLQRKLTADELSYLEDQGVDTQNLANQQVTVMNPDEYSAYSANQANQQAGIIKGGILPTLRSHAGSLLGGGLGATTAAAVVPEIAASWLGGPVTGIPGTLLGLGAMAAGGFAGSQLGNVVQKGVVEPNLLKMTPQQQA